MCAQHGRCRGTLAQQKLFSLDHPHQPQNRRSPRADAGNSACGVRRMIRSARQVGRNATVSWGPSRISPSGEQCRAAPIPTMHKSRQRRWSAGRCGLDSLVPVSLALALRAKNGFRHDITPNKGRSHPSIHQQRSRPKPTDKASGYRASRLELCAARLRFACHHLMPGAPA
jgi:hypothetical protein